MGICLPCLLVNKGIILYNDIALVCGTYISIKLLTVLVKLVYEVNINIIVFGRLIIAGIISLWYVIHNWRDLRNIKAHLYLLCAILRYVTIICTYYGYQRLSLQTVTAIGLSQPFFTILFSFKYFNLLFIESACCCAADAYFCNAF